MKTLGVEIYDECALTMDELIGYGQITIPEVVFCGESVDDWFQLSGKQGENKEGSIHLIFTLSVYNDVAIYKETYNNLLFNSPFRQRQ